MNEPTFEGLGHRLKAQREEKGISLREISEKTKIPVSILEALEAGDPTRLPASVFVKGFLRSYSLEVGLSPEEIIQEYKFQTPDQIEPDVVPVTARKDSLQGHSYWIGILVLVVAVIIGGGVYLLYPQIKSSGLFGQGATPPPPILEETKGMTEERSDLDLNAEAPAAPEASDKQSGEKDEPESTVEQPGKEEIKDDGAEEKPASVTAEKTEEAAAVPSAETAAPAEKPVEQPVAEATAAAEPAKEHVLKLEFTAEVWVSLLIDGKTVRHGLYKSGMSESWTASNDFRLNVGNAGGVRVYFDGQDLGVPGKPGQVVNLVLPKAGE